MPVKANAPLVTRKLLSAMLDHRNAMRKAPPALRHLQNSLEWGDVMDVLHNLVGRSDVEKAAYAAYVPDHESTRDAGIADAQMFAYLHNAYGRIAPLGSFVRTFAGEVTNGGHDQYCFNQLAGAKPEKSSLALLITLIEALELERLSGGDIVLAHLHSVQEMCLRKRDRIMAGYQDGDQDSDWDALDDAFYDTVAPMGYDCPWNVWERHVNARLREVIREKDRWNRLSSVYKAWDGLPPPTGMQVYEIESDKVTKAFVEKWNKERDAKNQK